MSAPFLRPAEQRALRLLAPTGTVVYSGYDYGLALLQRRGYVAASRRSRHCPTRYTLTSAGAAVMALVAAEPAR